MKFIYAKYSLQNKQKLLNIILQHYLHNSSSLSKMREWSQFPPDKIESVVVAFKPSYINFGYRINSCYIGSAIVTNFTDYNTSGSVPCNMGVWVDSRYRRLGIGSKMTQILKENASIKLLPWNLNGVPKAFFDKILG